MIRAWLRRRPREVEGLKLLVAELEADVRARDRRIAELQGALFVHLAPEMARGLLWYARWGIEQKRRLVEDPTLRRTALGRAPVSGPASPTERWPTRAEHPRGGTS